MKSLTQFIQEACKGNNCKNKKNLQDILNNKKRLKEINDILGESLEEINESNSQNDINVHVIYFIPQYAFEDEKYPVSIIIYSDKIKLKEDTNGIHIFNFDMSNAITGVSESQMFEIFIERVDTKNILSYVSYSVKDKTIPTEIRKIRYNGKTFEEYNEKYAIMTLK